MVVSDKTYIDPADFFDPESPRPERSIFAKYWTMVVFPTAAVLSVCGGNYAARRPYFAGIHAHFLYGTIALAAGYYVDKWTRERAARRDQFFFQYIKSHPEDFPVVERKKFRDVLEPWMPVR